MKDIRVFISYSHDSKSHGEKVLQFSERLREDGLETILDRYVSGSPVEGWPRWMTDKLELATHVLLVCTETYYRRFRGHDEPGKGKGVDWEGAIITQVLYDNKSRTNKFIPVLLSDSKEQFIPDPLRGQTYYRVDTEDSYLRLCDAILDQYGIEPGPIGQQKSRARVVAPPLRFSEVSGDSAVKTATKATGNHEVSGHMYSLMEVQGLIGRKDELMLLDDWVGAQQNSKFENVSVFVLNAIGGMGKSAILWHWLRNSRAEVEGRIWWSFYDDPSFDSFVAYSLHRLSGRLQEEVQAMFPTKRVAAYDQLLSELQSRPFLVSLDGLERILIAYSKLDAESLSDEEFESHATRDSASLQSRLPIANRNDTMRRCIEPLVGDFLKRTCHFMKSRIVVSTRLFPTDLQSITGDVRSGVYERKLQGLSDDDAVALWQAYGLSGNRVDLIGLFRTFDNHPLLIKVLAAEVAKNRKNPGDFEKWRAANPNFSPFGLPVKQVQTHILQQALCGLNVEEDATLATLSSFRVPIHYDTLSSMLVRDGGPFCNAGQLDDALESLEDRGLLGWDRKANRYDMHPLVRGVVWNLQDGIVKTNTSEQLIAFFDAAETGRDRLELITSIDQLAIPIEKVNLLLRMGRYKDAGTLWSSRLSTQFEYRIFNPRQHSVILEKFFPDGDPFSANFDEAQCIRRALAHAYIATARPSKALPLVRKRAEECDCEGCQLLVAQTMISLGKLADAEVVIRSQLSRSVEYAYTALLGCWLDRGVNGIPVVKLNNVCRTQLGVEEWNKREDYTNRFAAWFDWTNSNIRLALRRNNYIEAKLLSARLMNGAKAQNNLGSVIEAGIVEGSVFLVRFEFDRALERTNWAIAESRRNEHEKLELTALIQKTAIKVGCKEYDGASETLSDAWLRLTEGPLPKLLSQARLLDAKIQEAKGNRANASESAIAAVTHAWCDGPPFAFHDELTAAEAMCKEIGVDVPSLPSFKGETTIPVIIRKTT